MNARIDQRVLAGEHYVRPDIVEERYVNSLNLLNHYFHIPDHLQLFDNSKSLQLVAEIKKGEVQQLHSSLPAWVANKLSAHFNRNEIKKEKKVSDMDSIEEVRKSYQEFKKRAAEVLGKKTEVNQYKEMPSQNKSQGKKRRLG